MEQVQQDGSRSNEDMGQVGRVDLAEIAWQETVLSEKKTSQISKAAAAQGPPLPSRAVE